MPEPIRCELVSWPTVQRLVRELASRIRASGFEPDIIIAIARGAYVPARLLCDQLDITELTSIRIVHYRAGAERQARARLAEGLCTSLRGRRALIVDDVSDTGDTLNMARRHVMEHGPRETRVAVLHHKRTSTERPDFYAKRVIKWRWIIYPWAVLEDLRGLIARMSGRPTAPDALAERLERDHGIRVSGDVLRDALAQGTSVPR